jgi:tetratricopeptide (TPR) repeat protein
MQWRYLLVAITATSASSAFALDKVKLRQGVPVSGTLTAMSPDEVEVEAGPVRKKIPVNQILYIEYDDEPNELSLVRGAYASGKYDQTLELLEKIDEAKISRNEVKQDLAFYKAASMAHLALAGSGSSQEAGRALLAFESKDSGNYHYLETCQLIGDLLVSAGKLDAASRYYDKLANSQFPEYKLKAGVLLARALEAQKKYAEAILKYDEVINGDGDSPDAQSQKLAAVCGKATCLAATGKVDEAVKMVEDVIGKADAGDLELHARAYNALGSVYRAAGKKKEALMAYLHTDLLFAGFPEQHAEALAALAELWRDADKADRAAQAAQTLKDRYPGSRWAQGK